MSLNTSEADLVERVRAKQAQLEDWLDELVAVASPTHNADGVNEVGRLIEKHFLRAGLRTSVLVTGSSGQHLMARTPSREGNRLLMLGHMDTVHDEGGVLRREGDRLLGPGSADMKGGLVALIGAVQGLQESNLLADRHLTILLTADEETGSPTARSLLSDEAADHHLCLVLECGSPMAGGASSVVSERSGMQRLKMSIKGVASHSGAAPTSGRSAAVSMARLILKLEELNQPDARVSVNVGLCSAGTAVNTVPAQAALEVDCRFPATESREQLLIAIDRIVQDCRKSDAVEIEVERGVGHEPLIRSEAMDRMVRRIQKWALDLGQEIVEERRGGCSDGNVIAAAGCPVVDGLGVVGGHMHSPDEWMLRESLSERAALLALTAHRFYEL